jgi:Domain of unknown function (DUF1874)
MDYITHTFSGQMIAGDSTFLLRKQPISLDEAKEFVKDAKSLVGFENTAEMLSDELETEIAFNRESVSLNFGDKVLVTQFHNDRNIEFPTDITPKDYEITYDLYTVLNFDTIINLLHEATGFNGFSVQSTGARIQTIINELKG